MEKYKLSNLLIWLQGLVIWSVLDPANPFSEFALSL